MGCEAVVSHGQKSGRRKGGPVGRHCLFPLSLIGPAKLPCAGKAAGRIYFPKLCHSGHLQRDGKQRTDTEDEEESTTGKEVPAHYLGAHESQEFPEWSHKQFIWAANCSWHTHQLLYTLPRLHVLTCLHTHRCYLLMGGSSKLPLLSQETHTLLPVVSQGPFYDLHRTKAETLRTVQNTLST